MADGEPEHNPDEAAVLTAVTRMLAHNDWRLLDAADLTQRVLALLNDKPGPQSDAGRTADTVSQEPARSWPWRELDAAGRHRHYNPIEGAALHEYAKALYSAYANRMDEERQRRAYYELFRYVIRAASRWAADLSRDEREEIAYHVLAELYFRLVASHEEEGEPRGVRVAGAFLAITLQQMKNDVRQWRATTRHWITLTAEDDDSTSGKPTIDNLPNTQEAYETNLYAEQMELRVRIVRLFTGALERYPRARIQLHVVWLHQIERLDYPAIADRLGMTVANVRVLYCRGIRRLRNEPGFRALAEEEHLITASQPTRNFERQPDIQREHSI